MRPTTAALVQAAWGIGSGRPPGAPAQPPPQLGSFGEPSPDLVVNEGEEVLAKFESDPSGASVRMDGELLCRATPCSKRVRGGRHEVVFEQERYSAARVSAVVGKGAVVRGTLQPKFGWLTVETDSPGVAITVNGVEVGKTPVANHEADEGLVEVAVADGC